MSPCSVPALPPPRWRRESGDHDAFSFLMWVSDCGGGQRRGTGGDSGQGTSAW